MILWVLLIIALIINPFSADIYKNNELNADEIWEEAILDIDDVRYIEYNSIEPENEWDDYTIDTSTIASGYITIVYFNEDDDTAVVLVYTESDKIYGFEVESGEYMYIPLTNGDGKYDILLGNVADNSIIGYDEIDVETDDEFEQFLIPNKRVWYDRDSNIVKKSIEIAKKSRSKDEYIKKSHDFVVKLIAYYIPLGKDNGIKSVDIDETLETGKGVCLEYATVLTALLRIQGIPAKLCCGYEEVSNSTSKSWNEAYINYQEVGHAWVEAYVDDEWIVLDPTFSDGDGKFERDKSKYTVDFYN